MGQLGELAKKEKERRDKIAEAGLAGLKKASEPPVTDVTIVGGGKTPGDRAHDEAVERHKQSVAKAKAKVAAKKASTGGY